MRVVRQSGVLLSPSQAGAAVAMKLASEGANVAINYFASSKGADETVAKIEAAGGKAIAVQGDLKDEDQVNALVAKTVKTFGSVDVLVNNAGGLVERQKVADMTLDHWNEVMTLNLTSTFLMTRACLAQMENGTIVNLASQAGRDGGGPGAVPYATSKGAVMTMTRGLAKELGPNIRVNALCPGMIDTDFHNIARTRLIKANQVESVLADIDAYRHQLIKACLLHATTPVCRNQLSQLADVEPALYRSIIEADARLVTAERAATAF